MVRVEDNKIYSTTRLHTGEEWTTVKTIRTLSARVLLVADQRGNRTGMEGTK